MSNLIWSVALAAVGILGIYLAGSKNLWGWAVSFGAQAAWIVFALVTAQYGFILSALAYGFVYGRNYLRWKRERIETGPNSEPNYLANPCICGHPKSFHAPHLGCSGSHHDSRPCTTYRDHV